MKKIFIVAGVVILLAVAGRAFWAYQQVKVDEQRITPVLSIEKSTDSITVQTMNTTAVEDGMVSGDKRGPDCEYDKIDDVTKAIISKAYCRPFFEIKGSVELSDDIKNSTYIVDINSPTKVSNSDGSLIYYVSEFLVFNPTKDVRFLGSGQSLITKEIYNKLFHENTIDVKNSLRVLSPRCSDNKAVLPTVDSPLCDSYRAEENNIYLFNEKGERLATLADFKKNLIKQPRIDFGDPASLDTIKKMKNNIDLVFDGNIVYIPIGNPLEQIIVAYRGFIDGNKLMPKDKIEEISYFKDGSSTTIK